MARRATALIAVVALIAGAVFALQGLRVLPSALMYGKPEWIVIGLVLVAASLFTLRRLAVSR
ncbi:MAG: hypothetical protein KGN00_03015 [Chloroflexota bacterium]|nr:hypothetical protein [Chloroflexota bacterium]MDE3192636.1 hypothetical protein [Chloroflexota bacterium]